MHMLHLNFAHTGKDMCTYRGEMHMLQLQIKTRNGIKLRQ
jgi:hypothetical protein